MTTTVYFATNRTRNGPPDRIDSYTDSSTASDRPQDITYGTAFVQTSAQSEGKGVITLIKDVQQGGFAPSVIGDLKAGTRNVLLFVHGFANSFEDGLVRAAFNREWLLEGGADTAVIAFSWPSLGKVITLPFPTTAYETDRNMAAQSGPQIRAFLSNLLPIFQEVHNKGKRTLLLAHSMGNLALQAAIESWFTTGNGDAFLFHEALLAAADEVYTTFDFTPNGRLSGLSRLSRRVSIYYSRNDLVLKDLSQVINGGKRLGQDGPRDRDNPARFPTGTYRMVDCTGVTDNPAGFQNSHQYYRRSRQVRSDIVGVMV